LSRTKLTIKEGKLNLKEEDKERLTITLGKDLSDRIKISMIPKNIDSSSEEPTPNTLFRSSIPQ